MPPKRAHSAGLRPRRIFARRARGSGIGPPSCRDVTSAQFRSNCNSVAITYMMHLPGRRGERGGGERGGAGSAAARRRGERGGAGSAGSAGDVGRSEAGSAAAQGARRRGERGGAGSGGSAGDVGRSEAGSAAAQGARGQLVTSAEVKRGARRRRERGVSW